MTRGLTHTVSYALLRDQYYRSFGDRTLRLNFRRWLENRGSERVQNLFAGLFLIEDFICLDCGTTDVRIQRNCPRCNRMLCGDCSYAVCGQCHRELWT